MQFFYFIIFFIFKFALVGSTFFLVMVNRTVLSVFIPISAFIIASGISILLGGVLPPSFYFTLSGVLWSFVFYGLAIFDVQSFYKYKDLVLLMFVIGVLAFMPPFFFIGEKIFLIRIFFQIFVRSPKHWDWKVFGMFLGLITILFFVPFFFLFQHGPTFSLFSAINAEEERVGFPIRSATGEVGFPVQYREWKTVERFPIHGTSVYFEQPVAWEAYYPLFTVSEYIRMGEGADSDSTEPIILPSLPANLAEKPIPSGKEEEVDFFVEEYPDLNLSSAELDALATTFNRQVKKLAVTVNLNDYNLFKGSHPASILSDSHFDISLTERQVMAFRFKSQNFSAIDWQALMFEVCRVAPVVCHKGAPLDTYTNKVIMGLSEETISPEEFIGCLRTNPIFDSYISHHLTYSLCRSYIVTHPDFGSSFWSVADLKDDYISTISKYVEEVYYRPMIQAQVNEKFDNSVNRVLSASLAVRLNTYDQIPHMSSKNMAFGNPHSQLSEVEKIILGFRASTPRAFRSDPIVWGYYMDLLRDSLELEDFPDVFGPKRFGDHLEFFRSFFQSKIDAKDFLVYIRKNRDVDELFSQVLVLELCFLRTWAD